MVFAQAVGFRTQHVGVLKKTPMQSEHTPSSASVFLYIMFPINIYMD